MPTKFQNSVLVDTAVAEEIAADFARHKKEKHGDTWVLLLLDNLPVHIAVSA